MYFANNLNGDRVHITDAEPNEEYFCPLCGCKLLIRRGKIYAPHFAHHSNSLCVDNWTHDMSEWHRNWQNQFPHDTQEIVVENHRADVLVNNIVYEFQHSPITEQEFNERNIFYTSHGYKVIWVFDVSSRCIEQRSVYDYFNHTNIYIPGCFEWKHRAHFLDNYNFKNPSVAVFLEFDTDEIIKLTWHPNNTMDHFKSNGTIYSTDGIVNFYTNAIKLTDAEPGKYRHIWRNTEVYKNTEPGITPVRGTFLYNNKYFEIYYSSEPYWKKL